jgi:hypothetical protein
VTLNVITALIVIISVCPSGSARASPIAAVTPPAPGRLSTTNGLPRRCVSFCAICRARMSIAPPGGNGTTKVTGRLG